MQPVVNEAKATLAEVPVSADEFKELVKSAWALSTEPTSIGVAVSGGSDSLALALCSKRWSDEQQIPITAFIVDHDLREGSAEEALATCALLKARGIEAKILHWTHEPVVTRLHATARKARYRLLVDACHAANISTLWLGHHREDQAETILMRLAKGSGIDGLAGMSPRSDVGDITLLRPFLTVSKDRLIATCVEEGVAFFHDKSNASERFARGRLRRVMPYLSGEGLTIDRLIDLGGRAKDAKEALNYAKTAYLNEYAERDIAGVVRCDLTAFRELPTSIAERVLIACLQTVHREDYAPEHTSVKDLRKRLVGMEDMPARTLHGCLILKKKNVIVVVRETMSIQAVEIRRSETLLWDQRWWVSLSPLMSSTEACVVKPLGNPPLEVLERLAPSFKGRVPLARAREALPSLWMNDALIAVPTLVADQERSLLAARQADTWLYGRSSRKK